MSKRALISCEASLQIGTGHVMRCLVLADELKKNGFDVTFITSATSANLISDLARFPQITSEDFFLNPAAQDLLVVDNYSLDALYEKRFRKYVKTILVIDDLANRKHDCDILLDQNLGTKKDDYRDFVSADCQILAGANYCLLRPEFSALRDEAIKKRSETKSVKKILVNFGGSDINNHSLAALRLIENSNFVGEVDVVLGFNAPNFDSVADFAVKSRNKITVHKRANMSELILAADAAIAAGGTSAWERCCLALPTYIIKIADNQEKIFRELGYKMDFNEFISSLNSDYQKHVSRIVNYVDGLGVKRVVDVVLTTSLRA